MYGVGNTAIHHRDDQCIDLLVHGVIYEDVLIDSNFNEFVLDDGECQIGMLSE